MGMAAMFVVDMVMVVMFMMVVAVMGVPMVLMMCLGAKRGPDQVKA